jgi:2,4-dienoyl-CoA reductase-like NADH-dependent reductase (Old Yellow Enzyme family)
MCQYSAEEGVATDWHHVHLGTRAVGGAGLVMTEATAVEPRGRITPDCLGIWSDEHAAALEPIVSFVESQGAVPAVQLAHAGRKGSHAPPSAGGHALPADHEDGWETISASDEPYPGEETAATSRMDADDVEAVVEAFVDAAARSLEAGFEVAEVHAAHGYLLHQFLSPVTNDRDDDYGGSFENRTRLVCAVVDVDDAVRLVPLLADAGADLIDVSGGGIHPDQQLPNTGPGYQVPYAETIREATDVPVAAVGKVTEPAHADALVRNGRADLVALGRELLRNPYWPLEAAHELGVDVEWPVQYRRGRFE